VWKEAVPCKRHVWCLLASKEPFHLVIESITKSSFYWCDACLYWWFSLVLVSILFFSPSLSSLKKYNLPLLVIDVSILVFIFLILISLSWFFCRSFYFIFNFITQYQFIKYYVLQYGPHSLDFNLILIVLISNFFLGFFYKNYYSF